MSLRKVAKKVGVSHTAPHNHFKDKQALLAAISTAGHRKLYETMLQKFESIKDTSSDIIIEIAWAYLHFALDDPDRFKLMFSGALDEETNHPDFLDIADKNMTRLAEIFKFSQRQERTPPGDIKPISIKIWSSVHRFTLLKLENQFPTFYTEKTDLIGLLKIAIS